MSLGIKGESANLQSHLCLLSSVLILATRYSPLRSPTLYYVHDTLYKVQWIPSTGPQFPLSISIGG
jgi:hypothetical protein